MFVSISNKFESMAAGFWKSNTSWDTGREDNRIHVRKIRGDILDERLHSFAASSNVKVYGLDPIVGTTELAQSVLTTTDDDNGRLGR